MGIGCVCVNWHLLARYGALSLGHVERPQQRGARDKELVVDNVHAQTLASTPSECVLAVLRVAEVGVSGQRLLVGWERRVEPAVRAVIVGVGVFRLNAVDRPG